MNVANSTVILASRIFFLMKKTENSFEINTFHLLNIERLFLWVITMICFIQKMKTFKERVENVSGKKQFYDIRSTDYKQAIKACVVLSIFECLFQPLKENKATFVVDLSQLGAVA